MRKRPRTWKVIRWDGNPMPDGEPFPAECPNCGADAMLPTHGRPGALVIASWGLSVIFDPPGHIPPKDWFPDEIQCRSCRHIFGAHK